MKALAWFLIGFAFMVLLGIGSANAAYCSKFIVANPADEMAVRVINSGFESTAEQMANCNTAVYISASEYRQFMANSSLWGLSPSEASQIASAILLLWAVAFVFRLLIRALSIGDNSEERNEA